MRAGLRWKMALLVGGLLVAGAPAFAQTVPDATGNAPAPATDAVGPRELQNFSLPGTTTKPVDQPTTDPAPASPAAHGETVAEGSPGPAPAPARRVPGQRATRDAASVHPPLSQTAPQTSAAEVSPPLFAPTTPAPPLAQGGFGAAVPGPPAQTPAAPVTAARRPSLIPWLIAALVLATGTIFLLWRRSRQRETFAGHDIFVPPDQARAVPAPSIAARSINPAPQPVAQPKAAPVETGARRGIVASRLRPSLELGVQPLRCLVDDDQVTIEFEVELFNSGTAPARSVIAEASLFNASASQDQELAAFYAKPPADGDRIDSIPPMRRMTFTNRVVAPRAAVQEYELAGRKAFVPVLAFNAQYEWSGGNGQSSLAFLLGRETRGEKLGPLHLDGGEREVRGLGARVLSTAVRT